MTSSKKHPDIESGDSARERQHDVSDSVYDNKRQPFNWETYTHSGPKATFAWLVFLLLVLGLAFEQASLSNIGVQTSTTRSTHENGSFASPDLAGSESAAKRQMVEVVEDTVGKSSSSAASESVEEQIEPEPKE